MKIKTISQLKTRLLQEIQMNAVLNVDFDKWEKIRPKDSEEFRDLLVELVSLMASAEMLSIPHYDSRSKCTNSLEISHVTPNGGVQINTKKFSRHCELWEKKHAKNKKRSK